MIHLYKWDNNDYTTNGDVILLPSRCEVTAGINRTWQVDIEHPIDEEGRWRHIEVGAVLKTPSFNGTQLWRIVQTTKADSGIQATCDPIYYDAAQYVVFPDKITMVDKTPKEIMDTLSEGTIFKCESDVTERDTISFENENLVAAVTGTEKGIVKSFNCEIGFDNYTIQIMQQLGSDNGASVLYGKNLIVDGMNEAVNIDGTVTRLCPIAYNGYKLPELYVDSPLIDDYPMPRVGFVLYENLRLEQDRVNGEESEEGIEYFATKEQLYYAMRIAARKEYVENEIDKPSVSIDVNMVLLRNTEEYKDYKALETVSVGDYVTCKHNRLGIETKTRVRKLVYDCIRETVTEVELGDAKRRYFDNVSSVVEAAATAITPNGNVVAERIMGTMNGAEAQIKLQNTADKSNFARALFIEDLDSSSATYGALSLGTPGLQLSNERQGNDWKWETAVTPDGIIADFITAGTLKGITITSEDPDIPLPISVKIEQGTLITSATYPGGDVKSANLSEGMLILDYGSNRSRFSPEEIYISNGTTSTAIEAGVVSVGGDPGITDTINVGGVSLEFKGGILIGVS